MSKGPPPREELQRPAHRPRKPLIEFPRFDSMEQMAAATGVPLDILKAAKREGCMFVVHGRCDSGVFFRWWFEKRMDAEERENWTRRDKRASALTKEFVLEQKRGESISFESVRRFLRELIGPLFAGELDRLAQELPAALKGMSEVEIRKEVLRQKESVKRAFFGRIDSWDSSKGKE